MIPLFSSLLAVTFISLVSVVGLYLMMSRISSFTKYSLSLVGVAVGSLLGDAFIHLLPEAYREIDNSTIVSLLVIVGILIFFSLEKIVRWRHCHDPDCDDHEAGHIVAVSLVGELFHNFIDGVIIAGSFIIDPKIGLATSLAVLIHEIPQELGHFGIYIHQGLSLRKALTINLITATSAFFGVIVTFLIGAWLSEFSSYILPITAGGFIYLASSDLIPELHRHQQDTASSLRQIFLVILGVALMLFLILID